MKLTDITPERFRGIAACPAIFESNNGTFVLTGRKLDDKECCKISSRIGQHEAAVEIPQELLSELIKKD